ncbi:MAG: ABC transporter permease subunit [Streptosporangiales bacterium]|nr:ABC transporter permease subunit [Streptosporangiales bacterium]
MTALPHAGRRGRQPSAVLVGSVLVLVGTVVAWWAAAQVLFVIPQPTDTVRALAEHLVDPAFRTDMRVTALAVLMAFGIGTLVGALAGLALGLSTWVRATFEPLVIGLNGIPKIVLYPVLLPVFHLGYGSKVVMGVLFALFPVLINVAVGVREVPRVYRKLARSLDASWWQYLVHILVPAIRLPLLTGVRLSVSLATVGVVLSEFFATKQGLGRSILRSYGAGDYPDMMSTILLLVSVSFVVSLLLWRLERRAR